MNEMQTITAQSLLGRKVVDINGRKIGRVYDLRAEHVDGELCITHLLVGPRTWLERFGWARGDDGKKVAWDQIEILPDELRLQNERGNR